MVDFLARHRPSAVYLSNPTWVNHPEIFKNEKMVTREYRYFDSKKNSLDFDGMIEDLKNATPGSIVLL